MTVVERALLTRLDDHLRVAFDTVPLREARCLCGDSEHYSNPDCWPCAVRQALADAERVTGC